MPEPLAERSAKSADAEQGTREEQPVTNASPSESQNQAPYYANPCDYPKTHDDSDLCAQWTAATAADETASWLPYNAKLGTVEAVGIVLSLIVSTLSAFFAFRALRSSHRAEERQNRAYVFPDGVTVSARLGAKFKQEIRGKPFSALTIKNSGQTPAYRLVHWGDIVIIPIADEDSLVPPALAQQFQNDLPPGGTQHKWCDMKRRATRAEIAAIKRAETGIFVYGRIEYRDAFNYKRFTNYRLVFTGMWPPPAGVLLNFCSGGNSSN